MSNAKLKVLAGIVVVVLIAIIISCSDDPASVDSNNNDEPDLAGTAWKLTTVESISDTLFDSYENGTWQVPETAQYLLEFTPDSSVYAFLYCEECPDSEESRFEVAGEDSVSINLNCESRSVCQKNIPVRKRLESVVTVEQENETLKAEYVFKGDESEEFRGRLHFSRAENVRPEPVPFEVMRGHMVANCWLNPDSLDLNDNIADLSKLDRLDDISKVIKSEDDFEKYVVCNEDVDVNLDEEIYLAGISRRHYQCIRAEFQDAILVNNLLHYRTGIIQLDCDAVMRVGYMIRIPADYRDFEKKHNTFWKVWR